MSRKCRVNLRPSRLEQSDADGPRWWMERCAELEREVHKEVTLRPAELLAVIGNRHTFKTVSGIFKLDDNECDQLCIKALERERSEKAERERQELVAREREERKSIKTSKKSRSVDLSHAMYLAALATEDDDDEDDEEEESSTSSAGSTKKEEEEVEVVDLWSASCSTEEGSEGSLSNQPGSHPDTQMAPCPERYTNPYLSFLRRPADSAPTWRPRPPPVPTGVYEADPVMTLEEKSFAITDKIARDFCAWTRGLCSVTPPEIDERTLVDLFELAFDKPASRALVCRFQETVALTPSLAKAWLHPQLDYREYLRAQIQEDITAEAQPPKKMAFGQQLEPGYRVDPPLNNTQTQWRGYRPPSDLATFTAAFTNLAHLESFVGYCKFLERNPTLGRPPCLKKWGLFSALTATAGRDAPAPSQSTVFGEESLGAPVSASVLSAAVSSQMAPSTWSLGED